MRRFTQILINDRIFGIREDRRGVDVVVSTCRIHRLLGLLGEHRLAFSAPHAMAAAAIKRAAAWAAQFASSGLNPRWGWALPAVPAVVVVSSVSGRYRSNRGKMSAFGQMPGCWGQLPVPSEC